MKMPENNAVMEHRDVHDIGRHLEIGGHRRGDVERGLGKQPERQHTENDSSNGTGW